VSPDPRRKLAEYILTIIEPFRCAREGERSQVRLFLSVRADIISYYGDSDDVHLTTAQTKGNAAAVTQFRSPSLSLVRFIEQPDIGVITETSVAGLAGDLGEDARLDETLHELIGGGVCGAGERSHFFYRRDRPLE
jgi:hypothetical protein